MREDRDREVKATDNHTRNGDLNRVTMVVKDVATSDPRWVVSGCGMSGFSRNFLTVSNQNSVCLVLVANRVRERIQIFLFTTGFSILFSPNAICACFPNFSLQFALVHAQKRIQSLSFAIGEFSSTTSFKFLAIGSLQHAFVSFAILWANLGIFQTIASHLFLNFFFRHKLLKTSSRSLDKTLNAPRQTCVNKIVAFNFMWGGCVTRS